MLQIFLQNAWSPLYAGSVWPRESWLRALYRSRSGKRLRLLITDPKDPYQPLPVRFENTTPEVAAESSGKLSPDPAHIMESLIRHSHPENAGPHPIRDHGEDPECWRVRLADWKNSQAVVACGKQAETSLIDLWKGPLLVVPHPAARVLTDALYRRGREILFAGLTERIALRQGRGQVIEEAIS